MKKAISLGVLLAAVALTPAGASAQKAIPAESGRPALALPDTAPAAGALKFPAGFKPGIRLTYQAGDSIVAGVGEKLKPVPGKNGQYVDPKTGQNYDVDKIKSSGGVGFTQVNVLATSADFVALDSRNFQITDIQRGIAASAGGAVAVGNAVSAGVYWINPTLLALVSGEGGVPQPAGVKISRQPFKIGDKQFNTLDIENDYANGFEHSVYDLDSGVLLLRTGSTVAGNVPVVDPATGNVSPGKGSTAIYHMIFTGARELKVPWADEPTPDWVAKGRTIEYGGGYNLTTPQGALPPLGLAKAVQIGQVTEGVALARVTTRSDIGAGLPPQDSKEDRGYGAAMFNPLWIGPKSLAKMQPNQVLDQDPITKFTTVFAGVRNGVAVVVERGPLEETQFLYNAQTGVLAGVSSVRQQPPVGQVNMQITLRRQQ